MNEARVKSIREYALIIVGTILLAVAITVFFDAYGFVVGGITGIAIIIKALTGWMIEGGIPIWLTNLVLNIPLFLAAILIKGKDFGKKSLIATVCLSVALYFTVNIPPIGVNITLSCIFGGVVAGIGLGLVFSAFATTGGTDLAASLIQQKIKYLSVAKIMMVLDGAIILGGFFVFGIEKTLYAWISIYISTKVIDAVLEGLNFAKAVFIISDYEREISDCLLHQLNRGVTSLKGEGMYTGNPKAVILCVVSLRQIGKLKEIVKEVDPGAFVIVADIREVLGEGFIQ